MIKIKNYRCNTKFPIVLVHGTGNRDYLKLNYWGKIPECLEQDGAKVFYGNQEAWQTIEVNAKILKKNILKILTSTHSSKVNIIAHSKGGLEARYMIDKLNMHSKVASLTTISTPHHGSKAVTIFCKFPTSLRKFIAIFVNLYFECLGDKKSNFYSASKQLSSTYCAKFNKQIKNFNSIYYQSYTSAMKTPFSDIFMLITYIAVYLLEGENDGLVSVSSAKWINFKGVIRSKNLNGISHCDIVGLRGLKVGKVDIDKFYINLVHKLKQKGF